MAEKVYNLHNEYLAWMNFYFNMVLFWPPQQDSNLVIDR